MSVITLILSGLVIGVIAKLLMPGRDPGGLIVTILIGVAGMFAVSYLGRALGLYSSGETAGWIMSIVGAFLLLWLYRKFFGRYSS